MPTRGLYYTYLEGLQVAASLPYPVYKYFRLTLSFLYLALHIVYIILQVQKSQWIFFFGIPCREKSGNFYQIEVELTKHR
jgi:hypothetical protein